LRSLAKTYLFVELVDGQALSAIFFSLLLVLFVSWVAKRQGFFRLPPPSLPYPIPFSLTLGAFIVYFFIAFPLLSLLKWIFVRFVSQEFAIDQRGWINFTSLSLVFLSLVIYGSLIKKEVKRVIFWGEGENTQRRFLKSFSMGLLTCLVSYPYVLLVNVLAKAISLVIWGEEQLKQVAVEHLKKTAADPVLFAFMIFAVVVMVPFMEELLFRGFLQSFLKRFFKRGWAIIVTALIFAFVHFAPSQGVGNFQLILSLFVLSSFIGFIYEKERALWAPIGLHMLFNGISVLIVILDT